MIRTPLCDLLGIEYPVFQGGMAWIADGKLAAAVSEGGGLGIIAAGNAPGDAVREQIQVAKSLTSRPFGVNIMLMSPFVEEVAQVVAEEKVAVVTTGAGNPTKYMALWKEAGIRVIPVVASVAMAKLMTRLGASALIAEGGESGGHVGELTTMALVPQVFDAVDLPVIAAGGIATGRGMLAAFALGAEGIQMGTRFALSEESSASDAFKRLCIGLEEGGTMLALKKIGPTRLIRNDFYTAVETAENRGASAEELKELLGRGRSKRGIFEGNLADGELEIGQIASLIRDLPPAGEIVRQIIDEYNAGVKSLTTL